MSENENYINVSQIFKTKPSLFLLPRKDRESYFHILTVKKSELDIVRNLPWFDELALSRGSQYDPHPTPEESTLYRNYFVGNSDLFESLLVEQVLSDYRLLFVLGEPGSGKTTILNYLLRHSEQFSEYRSKHYIVIITCNRAFGTNKEIIINENGMSKSNNLTLRESIILHLSEALNNLCSNHNCTVEHLYEDIVKDRPLAKSIREALRRLRKGDLNKATQSRVIHSLLEGPSYINRSLEWFEKTNPELTIDIVLDNTDCFNKEERETCFSALLPMIVRHNTKVIIPMRYPTYSEYLHNDVIYQFEGTAPPISLDSPGFREIIEKRLTNVPQKIGRYDKQIWDNKISKIKDGLASGAVVEIFNGIFGEDNREKLKALKFIMSSPQLPSPKDYANPDNVLRALILGDHLIAQNDYRFSRVINLFNGGFTPGYQNTLVRIRLLQIILEHEPVEVSGDQVIHILQNANYDGKLLISALNNLLRDDLLEIQERPDLKKLEYPQDIPLKVQTTQIGRYYIKNLLWNPTYVELMAQSTNIRKKYLYHEKGEDFVSIIERLTLQEGSVKKYLNSIFENHNYQLLVSLDSFIEYLASEEKLEAESCNNSLNKYNISSMLTKA